MELSVPTQDKNKKLQRPCCCSGTGNTKKRREQDGFHHKPFSSFKPPEETADRQTDVICVLAFIFTGKRFREIIKPSEIAQCTHTTFTIPETVSTAQVETKEKKNP